MVSTEEWVPSRVTNQHTFSMVCLCESRFFQFQLPKWQPISSNQNGDMDTPCEWTTLCLSINQECPLSMDRCTRYTLCRNRSLYDKPHMLLFLWDGCLSIHKQHRMHQCLIVTIDLKEMCAHLCCSARRCVCKVLSSQSSILGCDVDL